MKIIYQKGAKGMIEALIRLLVEKKELEDRYGWVSCFDVPEQYEKMEALGGSARILAEKESEDLKDTTASSLLNTCETIAQEVVNGNIDLEGSGFNFMDRDTYIETYITDCMNDEQLRLFESLFYWMDEKSRGEWLEANYIVNEPQSYTDLRKTFVIFVGDK